MILGGIPTNYRRKVWGIGLTLFVILLGGMCINSLLLPSEWVRQSAPEYIGAMGVAIFMAVYGFESWKSVDQKYNGQALRE